MPDLEEDIGEVMKLIDGTTAPSGCRKVIGIVGPPGSGKSTLAEALVDRLNQQEDGLAALVPMDGFHMDNAQLDQLGLRSVKGAPHTFDADVFVATLRSLRPVGSAGAVPLFDRSQDQTVPAGRTVADSVGILVVEGNYLLLASQPWQQVASLLDATVALRPSLGTLEQRLMKRWRAHGLSPQMAYGKTHGNDLNNAKRVLNESADATLTLHQLH
jgi:pantothenate kinase